MATTIQQGLSNFETAQRSATEASATALTLGDQLKSVLNEKLSNSPIVSERSGAASNFLTELGNAPTQVLPQNTGGTIYTPSEQANIISGRRAGALMPLLTANQRFDLLSGNISDIMGAGTRAAQADATSKQGEANLASTLLQNLFKVEELNLAKQKASQPSAASLKKIQELFEQTTALGEVEQEIKNAIKSLEGGSKQSTGLSQGFLREYRAGLEPNSILGSLFGVSPESANLESQFATINRKLFSSDEGAGKALTGPEKKLLQGIIPEVGVDEAINLQRLNQLLTEVASKKRLLSSSAMLFNQPTSGDGEDEWEVIQ